MLCLCVDPRLKASLFASPEAIALSGKSFSDSESAYEFLEDERILEKIYIVASEGFRLGIRSSCEIPSS